MAQPRIVEVDYYTFQAKLRAAAASGARIEKRDGARWQEYIKARNVNLYTIQAWVKVRFLGEKIKLAIIDAGGDWDGVYAWSEEDERVARWESGREPAESAAAPDPAESAGQEIKEEAAGAGEGAAAPDSAESVESPPAQEPASSPEAVENPPDPGGGESPAGQDREHQAAAQTVDHELHGEVRRDQERGEAEDAEPAPGVPQTGPGRGGDGVVHAGQDRCPRWRRQPRVVQTASREFSMGVPGP